MPDPADLKFHNKKLGRMTIAGTKACLFDLANKCPQKEEEVVSVIKNDLLHVPRMCIYSLCPF